MNVRNLKMRSGKKEISGRESVAKLHGAAGRTLKDYYQRRRMFLFIHSRKRSFKNTLHMQCHIEGRALGIPKDRNTCSSTLVRPAPASSATHDSAPGCLVPVTREGLRGSGRNRTVAPPARAIRRAPTEAVMK